MLLLMLFAFIAGIVTILSPCILPILPIVLSGSVGGGKRKPLGIVTGFVLSFTFFTLFLSTLVRSLNISADSLRVFSIVVIFLFGASLLIPKVQELLEQFFTRFSSLAPKNTQSTGFGGGVVIGLSLGLLWTPCVGPILASVITLALTGSVNASAFFITLSYALGTALPMLFITYTGRSLFQKVPWLLENTKKIQQIFGVIMIATAVGLFYDIDRKFQIWVLDTFPNYGTGLTRFEDIDIVKNQLDRLQGIDTEDLESQTGDPMFKIISDSSLGKAPELQPDGQWINSEPFTLEDQRGKVVLVDFWTYSCINCIRTIPYLRDWHEKYADDGLVIIGVHAPEFEFEKDFTNVQEAVEDFQIEYPVVQDNEFRTWRAYENRYWPAKYLIDRKGEIRYKHFGEGKYDETEQAIQLLLKETGATVDEQVSNPSYRTRTRTPEIYLGWQRMEYLSSKEQIVEDEISLYSHPDRLNENRFSYDGEWLIAEEFSHPQQGASLEISYEAQEVFMVMRAKDQSEPGTVRVFIDGDQVTEDIAGSDVVNGTVTVKGDRLYRIIKMEEPGRHLLRLEFEDDNTEIYTFTFG